jgi:glutamine amidotransferase-like uncharacterized protein
MQDRKNYKVLATRCGSCGCGCPTILEAENSDDLVVVGKFDELVQKSTIVSQHTGEGEAAITIPKSLLLEAVKALQSAD